MGARIFTWQNTVQRCLPKRPICGNRHDLPKALLSWLLEAGFRMQRHTMLPAGCSGTTDRNSLLLEIIHGGPGIQFREMVRESGLKNGVLSHYLKKIRKKWDGQSHENFKANKILPTADFRRGIQCDQDTEKADVAGSFTCADGKWHIGIQGYCKSLWKITLNGFDVFVSNGF